MHPPRPRSRILPVCLVAGLLVGSFPSFARAGMPSVTLTDIAQMRVQTMSFFIVLLLVSALVIKWIWNGLRRDFVRLPWVSYPRALGVVSLWGLLFILVLTMISGARELMTPGAWEKVGFTYRVTSDSDPGDRDVLQRMEAERTARLQALKRALWTYAARHNGRLPLDDRDESIDPSLWETSDPSRARFFYIGGRWINQGSHLVAYEPAISWQKRLALFSDGSIRSIGDREIDAARQSSARTSP